MFNRQRLPQDTFPDDFDTPAYREYRPRLRPGVGLWLRHSAPRLLFLSMFLLAIGGGFLAALLLLPSRLPQVVVVTALPSPTPVGDLVGDYPPDVAQISITVPAKIDSWLDLGQKRGYRFFAAPGIQWEITVIPDANFDPVLTLYNPDGSVAQINNDRVIGDRTSQVIFEASAVAQYGIMIESANSGTTLGGYTLQIMPLTQ